MKKLLNIALISFLFLLQSSALPVQAETAVLSISAIGDTYVAPGSEFTMDINVDQAVDFVGFQIKFFYNSDDFTLTDVSEGSSLVGSMTVNTTVDGEILLNYVNINNKINGNGTLFTLTFETSSTLVYGTYGLLYEDPAYHYEFISLDAQYNLSLIEEYTFDFPDIKRGFFGDVNLNETISITDVALIQLYLEGLYTFTPTTLILADVNRDDVINLTDCAQIQLFLADLITTLEPE